MCKKWCLPVGKVIVKGIKAFLDLRERRVGFEHGGHWRERNLQINTDFHLMAGRNTYLLSRKTLLELSSNGFDTFNIPIGGLSELVSFLPLYWRVLEERQRKQGVRGSVRKR